MENDCFLVDWLSFRACTHDFKSIVELLGLFDCTWTNCNGFYGYRLRSYCSGISIHYCNDSVDGVLVEMSGTGCRAFETFAHGGVLSDWVSLFNTIDSDSDEFVVTRLDIAFDDHSGSIPIRKIFRDVGLGNFVSRFKNTSITREDHPGKVGQTIYFGSPQSELRFRFYDKAYERGFYDGPSWIRLEAQLRRGVAASFIHQLISCDFDVANLFSGLLNNYLRFVVPSKTDINKKRWKVAPYWSKLVNDVLPVSLWTSKDLEYNKAACESYVYGQAGNSVYALIKLEGLEKFEQKLMDKKSKKIPIRIQNMISTELHAAALSDAASNGDNILEVINATA